MKVTFLFSFSLFKLPNLLLSVPPISSFFLAIWLAFLLHIFVISSCLLGPTVLSVLLREVSNCLSSLYHSSLLSHANPAFSALSFLCRFIESTALFSRNTKLSSSVASDQSSPSSVRFISLRFLCDLVLLAMQDLVPLFTKDMSSSVASHNVSSSSSSWDSS